MWWIVGALVATVFLAGCAWVAVTSNVEQPEYNAVVTDGDFEVRDYPALTMAEVTRSGPRRDAANSAFSPLANYIFAKEREGDKIAMTAPVTQTPREKIAMTAPVTQSQEGDGDWTVRFIMPAGRTIDTLPTPANAEVRLVEEPARRIAAVRFSGSWDDALFDEKLAALRDWVAKQGLVAAGEPTYAYYNDPFTPPFLRRNEVMLEVVEG